jgi:signal transduction histidine kinase
LDENEPKVSSERTIFADPGSATIDALARSKNEAGYGSAKELSGQLRRDLSPAQALTGGVYTAARYVEQRGFADSILPAWAWIYQPAFDLPTGWSTPGSDPEGAAIAREAFHDALDPTIVSVPDAATYLAVPIVSRGDGEEEFAAAVIAIPLAGDELPDANCKIGTTAIAAVVGMQMDNTVRSRAASRALQFAHAAARTQRELIEPHDRATALATAVDALAECEALIGATATELIDGTEREVTSFGDLDGPLDSSTGMIDDAKAGEARTAGRAELKVTIEGVQEAKIVVQSDLPLGEVERDTLNSVASAVSTAVARFRASATIESLRRSATRRLVEAQERERSMVAADIHDGVLQQLGATAIRLELAQSRVERQDFLTASTIIADGAKEIRSCARELRALLMELRPQVLDDNGLNAALNELGRHVEGVEVEVHSDLPDDLGSEFSITIFRIVQEALTNIQKHARASSAHVDVLIDSGSIKIDITDDGVGYEGAVTGPSAEGSHLGLLGMRERAQMFGGTFSISGASGGGTEIHATLPLDGSPAAGI